MYQAQSGKLNVTDLRYLNQGARGNRCRVRQGIGDIVLGGKSISKNVALGAQGATEEMVEELVIRRCLTSL
jgi:hypothetical protein